MESIQNKLLRLYPTLLTGWHHTDFLWQAQNRGRPFEYKDVFLLLLIIPAHHLMYGNMCDGNNNKSKGSPWSGGLSIGWAIGRSAVPILALLFIFWLNKHEKICGICGTRQKRVKEVKKVVRTYTRCIRNMPGRIVCMRHKGRLQCLTMTQLSNKPVGFSTGQLGEGVEDSSPPFSSRSVKPRLKGRRLGCQSGLQEGKEEIDVENLFCNNTQYHAIEIKINWIRKRAPLGGAKIKKIN